MVVVKRKICDQLYLEGTNHQYGDKTQEDVKAMQHFCHKIIIPLILVQQRKIYMWGKIVSNSK